MKRIVLFCILLSPFSNLFSNDTFFSLNGGALSFPGDQSTNIIMDKEVIYLSLFDDHFNIIVDFVFSNTANDETLNVGFPFEKEGYQGNGSISNFKSWTNGKKVPAEYFTIDKKWDKTSNIDYAYLRKVFFPKKSITQTKISYDSTYGKFFYPYASYLFGTGYKWRNNIGNIQLVINNYSKFVIDEIQIGNENKMNPINEPISFYGKQIIINFSNVEPNSDDKFYIFTTDVLSEVWIDDYPTLYKYDTELPSDKMIKYYTSDQLRILRNSIYAIHGYSFKSGDLIEFYKNRTWYKINPDFSESMLNEFEKKCVLYFLEQEELRK